MLSGGWTVGGRDGWEAVTGSGPEREEGYRQWL